MAPHQERVVAEKQDLDEKLSKLRQFISGLTFVGIETDEQVRLIRQEACMTDYSNVLGERIAAFPK